jgi:nucleotide-binding universal stress UspA family protein
MMNPMKIMIAYDGSARAQAALADLEIAGLPSLAEARIVAVVEPFQPAGPSEIAWGSGATDALETLTQRAGCILQEGRHRLERIFPDWELETEVYCGQRAMELVAQAVEWGPELLVISPLNRSKFERMVWGSLSGSVVENATCSVRVARDANLTDDIAKGLRLMVGYDGSRSAKSVIDELSMRQWPANTEVRLVVALEPSLPDRLGASAIQRQQMPLMFEDAAQILCKAGLRVSTSLLEGKPKSVLLDEAEEWGAHCIFVGRHRHNAFSRMFMESTSAAIASQAPCSVEIVREKQQRRFQSNQNRSQKVAVAV